MKRITGIVAGVALAALLAAVPAVAEAATRRVRIQPNDLSPFAAQQQDNRAAILNAGGAGSVLFWKELRLPRGAMIRGLSYRRLSSSAEETVVGVDRVRPGRTPAWQRIFGAASTEITPVGTTGITVTGTATGTSRRVLGGWTYFVLVGVTPTAAVGDITVRYSVP